MVQLFAHHDARFESLDFLGLHPVTAWEHVVAFTIYGLFLAVPLGAGLGARLWARRARAASGPVETAVGS